MQSRAPKIKETRGQLLGEDARMPPLDFGGYILEMATEIGLFESGWEDINGWMQATGAELSPWEANAIHACIVSYTCGVKEFDGAQAAQPWTDGYVNRDRAEKSAREILRGKRAPSGNS